MVPENQWRDKGSMMDKRTARKVYRSAFKSTIDELRTSYENNKINIKKEIDNKNNLCNVYIRKRPLLPHEPRKHEYDIVSCPSKNEIIIHDCLMHSDMKHMFIESYHHTFSECFDEKTDSDIVYEKTSKPLVLHAIKGGKATIMMYGQTGSGKTYTMKNIQENIANDLFSQPEDNIDFQISLSMVEIAGSKCSDLLHKNSQKLTVCDDKNGNTNLLGITETFVTDVSNFLSVIKKGTDNRATESTAINSVSSRSHFICFINLRYSSQNNKKNKSNNDNDDNNDNRDTNTSDSLYGQITLLDLAGSERNEDSHYHSAERRKETIEINSSHMALKQCIRSMNNRLNNNSNNNNNIDNINNTNNNSNNNESFVPFRMSLLTRILKDSLWGKNSIASVITTISPIPTDTEHTLHSLQYAGLMLSENPIIKKIKTDVIEKKEKVQSSNNISISEIREWDHDHVWKWILKQKKGHYSIYTSSSNKGPKLDGRQLLRFGLPRFVQLCDNNQSDGEYLFKSLHKMIKIAEAADKARRKINIVRK